MLYMDLHIKYHKTKICNFIVITWEYGAKINVNHYICIPIYNSRDKQFVINTNYCSLFLAIILD